MFFRTAEHILARAACVGEEGQMWAGLINTLTQNLGFILSVKNEICRLNNPSIVFINLVYSTKIKSKLFSLHQL